MKASNQQVDHEACAQISAGSPGGHRQIERAGTVLIAVGLAGFLFLAHALLSN